jgi:hypothetical protein
MFKAGEIRRGMLALLLIGGASAICACKGGAPRDLVNVQVVFFNHTQGPLGEKSYQGLSGESFTITISGLGYAEIDPDRIVVRKSAARETMGEFLRFSTSGSATLEYPEADETWEAYLMNGGTDYQLLDGLTPRLLARTLRWLRRDWDATGPEEPIVDAFDQFNSALDHPWKQYGRFELGDIGIRFEVGYGSNNLGLPSVFSTYSDPYYIKVDPALCPSYADKLKYFIQNIFKLSTYVLGLEGDVFLHNTICYQTTGSLNDVGRDLIAYIYVKNAAF